jgi:hypothetical protein
MNQLSRLFFVVIAVLVGMVIAVPRSYAGPTLYQTGFEDPPFMADLPLVGQDGWTAPPPLSPNAAIISTSKPRQGKQSVLVPGAALVHQDFINDATGGYYDAIGSYRKPVDYDTGGTQTVRVSAHVRVDGRQTATSNNFFSASIGAIGVQADDDSNGIGELAISSDGHVYGYSGTDQVPTFLTSAPVTLGEWHTLAVEADFASRTYSFFVDDECLGTFHFDPSVTQNTLRRGSMIVYAAPDKSPALKTNYTAHFDQFAIKVVEPEECEVGRADH